MKGDNESDEFLESNSKSKVRGGPNSSLTTILSIWNCVMGSSLLTMPWAFEKAGFTQTIVIMIVCGIICYYTGITASLCIELSAKVGSQSKEPCQLPEFQSVCRHYLGPWGEYAALFAADVVVVGALTVYYVLLSKFMFGAGISIYQLSKSDNTTIEAYVDSQKCINEITTGIKDTSSAEDDLKDTFSDFFHVNKSIPLYLLIILGLCCIRDSSFFNRFSALGTVTVFLIFFAVIYKAVGWGMNVDFGVETAKDYVKTGFNTKGAVVLPGILSMAYFIHSAVTTLVKDNKHQEKNKRDLGIAYILVFLTYTILGLVFYLTYPGYKGCITDMFIDNFDKREWIVPLMNILMFFRMLTVYPLLCYFIRVQNFTVFMKTDWPGYFRVFCVNLLLVVVGCLCAVFYDKIGDIIRYAGSFCALIYMFFLPCFLKMLSQKEDSLGQKWSDVPVWSLILHPLLIVVGICNFVSQVAVTAY